MEALKGFCDQKLLLSFKLLQHIMLPYQALCLQVSFSICPRNAMTGVERKAKKKIWVAIDCISTGNSPFRGKTQQ